MRTIRRSLPAVFDEDHPDKPVMEQEDVAGIKPSLFVGFFPAVEVDGQTGRKVADKQVPFHIRGAATLDEAFDKFDEELANAKNMLDQQNRQQQSKIHIAVAVQNIPLGLNGRMNGGR